MTCARRGAGAHPPAASAPSRTASSPPPPRGRARPDPRGGRARLSLLLPVAALLLGALGLFSAAPAQAQTTVTIWSATLTVDKHNLLYGCSSVTAGQDNCSDSSVLTDDDFTHGGTTYTVAGIRWASNFNNLYFILSGLTGAQSKTALDGLTLNVPGAALAFSSADTFGNVVSFVYDPATDWADGDSVSLSLTGPDTTAPGIAFPSSWTPTTGVAATIALTDAGAKVKKYGAIVVDGSTGTAANCDTASEVGSGNLTTLTTPLASVNYRYTPPSDSAGKKVCVYAEDAAGNSDSSLWATAIAQALPAKPAGLTATAGNMQVRLSWTNPNDASITKYQLSHKLKSASGSAPFVDISGSSATTTSHTVTGLTNGQPYEFWLRAVNSAGNGTHVGPVEATPAAAPDTTGPSVSAIAITSSPSAGQGGFYKIGDTIAVTATFDEAIVLTGSPTLKIRVGTAEKTATCAKKGTTGDDAKKLVCSYTVAVGDSDTDGIAVEAGKLAGTVKDAANNAATLTYTAITAQSGHKVDGVRPTVTSGSTGYFSNAGATTALAGPQKAGADIYTKVTFSENMKHVKSNAAAARPELFIRIGPTDTQYDILDNGDALASGDCKPNHATNTNVYICRYTVGTGANGAFRVKVGTNSQDKADNALGAVYTHAATLTLDTADPGITFPSSWTPTTGVAATITLSDAGTKIKKYGAILVDGSTGTAANCDTASEVGAGNLTTLDTPLASVNYPYTPPAGSAGKKVCVYAEDAVGNSDSSLWSTAIAQALPAQPSGLTATAGNMQVRLSWTNPNDASITKYQLAHKLKSASGHG